MIHHSKRNSRELLYRTRVSGCELQARISGRWRYRYYLCRGCCFDVPEYLFLLFHARYRTYWSYGDSSQ